MQMEIYPRIRNLREDSDLTQQQVGKAINVPQRTYAYYESGQRMVPPHVLCALADYYKVSVDFILGRTDKKKWIDYETRRAFSEMGLARFLFPEWYNLLHLLLQSFAKKYTINCKIIGKAVERWRRKAKGPVPFGWQPAVTNE